MGLSMFLVLPDPSVIFLTSHSQLLTLECWVYGLSPPPPMGRKPWQPGGEVIFRRCTKVSPPNQNTGSPSSQPSARHRQLVSSLVTPPQTTQIQAREKYCKTAEKRGGGKGAAIMKLKGTVSRHDIDIFCEGLNNLNSAFLVRYALMVFKVFQ